MKNDLTNKTIGKLTILKFLRYDKLKQSNIWLCQCECGNLVERSAKSLKKSLTPSCGCYKRERMSCGNPKHNLTKTPIYNLWKTIKKRVRVQKSYIELGIKMCEEWENNPVSFYNWCKENGYSKGLQLDRIDNLKGYSPDNCRFVTCKQNQNNRRNNIIVEYAGKKMTLPQASEKSGINYKVLQARYYRNGTKNLFLPVGEYSNRGE